MGNGITHVCALAGLPVTMLDAAALEGCGHDHPQHGPPGQPQADLRGGQGRRTGAHPRHHGVQPISVTPIEAATEKEDVKHAIFRALTPHLQPAACWRSNPRRSPYPTGRGDRPAGKIHRHAFHEPGARELLEIIRGIATDETTFQVVHNLAEKLGNFPRSPRIFPAFIVNRILVPMMQRAVYALYEGVGTVSGIDTSMRARADGPIGIGGFHRARHLPVHARSGLYEGLSDSKYRPCPLLVKYVEAGWLGRKTKRGFYDYTVTPPRRGWRRKAIVVAAEPSGAAIPDKVPTSAPRTAPPGRCPASTGRLRRTAVRRCCAASCSFRHKHFEQMTVWISRAFDRPVRREA